MAVQPTVTLAGTFLGLVAFLWLGGRTAEPVRAGDPVDVFADLNGAWRGEFVGWDEEGREQYRIRVSHRYHKVDAHTQKLVGKDTLPDGTVIELDGENTARRLENGQLELRCVVRKSNGETVRHRGRLGKGPRGEELVFWYSLDEGKRETFREWVEGDGDQAVYRIQGTGRYGKATYVMAGDYQAVKKD